MTTPLSPEIPEADIGSPAASSSPKQQKKNLKAKKNGWHDTPLKVVVVNCWSIVGKKAQMLNLLDATQADVIIGTESWLTSMIPDSEICPPGYTMFRKDRANGTGGGVFILISSELVSRPWLLRSQRGRDGLGSDTSQWIYQHLFPFIAHQTTVIKII